MDIFVNDTKKQDHQLSALRGADIEVGMDGYCGNLDFIKLRKCTTECAHFTGDGEQAAPIARLVTIESSFLTVDGMGAHVLQLMVCEQHPELACTSRRAVRSLRGKAI